MDKSAIIGLKKLIQVKRIFFRLSVNLNPLRQFVFDDFTHLVRKQIQPWKRTIRILTVAFPMVLFPLFICICPVVDGIFRELVIRQSLKRRSG